MKPAIYKTASNDQTSSAFDFILSDESVDRMGDIIVASGWELRNFRANPVALFGHSSQNLPIGKWRNVRISGKQLLGTLELAALGTSDFIDTIRGLIEQGILKAVSVGFSPIAYEPIDKENPWDGMKFTKQELHEVSVVNVPANANALLAKSLNPIVRQVLAKSGIAPVDTFVRPVKPIAEPGAIPPIQRIAKMATLREKIATKRAKIVELKAALEPLSLVLAGEDDLDAEQAEQFDEISAELLAAEKDLSRLLTVQRAQGAEADEVEATPRRSIGGGGALTIAGPVTLRAPKAGKDLRGAGLFSKMAAAQISAYMLREPFEAVLARAYPGRDDIEQLGHVWALTPEQRAATTPAQTTVAGWAAELVRQTYGDFMEDIKAFSVYSALSTMGGLKMNFDQTGRVIIPMRNQVTPGTTGDLAGAFFGEGKPIPVRRASFGSQTLTPKEMGVLTEFTREIAKRSTPAIEQLLRNAMETDTARAIDIALLDALPATAIRPAGLGLGVVPIAGSAAVDNDTALRADIQALLAPFIATNAATGLVWLMNPSASIAISLMTTALGASSMFAQQISGQRLGGFPVIESTNVGLTDLWLVRAVDFASATENAPEFEVSESATLHEEEAYSADITAGAAVLPIASGAAGAAVVATPVRSMFQTNSIALRMILGMNWAMMRPGEVQKATAITWTT